MCEPLASSSREQHRQSRFRAAFSTIFRPCEVPRCFGVARQAIRGNPGTKIYRTGHSDSGGGGFALNLAAPVEEPQSMCLSSVRNAPL